MTTSTLVYSTDRHAEFYPEVTEDECCLGMQGVISTSSCNRISVSLTGDWCPSCHPGDDVPVSAAFN